MIGSVLLMLAAVAVGFGLGRIKNAGKLAKIQAELNLVEAKASSEVAVLVARLRSIL